MTYFMFKIQRSPGAHALTAITLYLDYRVIHNFFRKYNDNNTKIDMNLTNLNIRYRSLNH